MNPSKLMEKYELEEIYNLNKSLAALKASLWMK